MREQCKHCRAFVTPALRWKGPHVEARCPDCGRHVKFVPRTAAVLAIVGPKPPAKGPAADLFGG